MEEVASRMSLLRRGLEGEAVVVVVLLLHLWVAEEEVEEDRLLRLGAEEVAVVLHCRA